MRQEPASAIEDRCATVATHLPGDAAAVSLTDSGTLEIVDKHPLDLMHRGNSFSGRSTIAGFWFYRQVQFLGPIEDRFG
jgi:hypothetical protein